MLILQGTRRVWSALKVLRLVSSLLTSFIQVILRLILRFREPIYGSGTRFLLCPHQQEAQHERSASVVAIGAEDPLSTLYARGGRG